MAAADRPALGERQGGAGRVSRRHALLAAGIGEERFALLGGADQPQRRGALGGAGPVVQDEIRQQEPAPDVVASGWVNPARGQAQRLEGRWRHDLAALQLRVPGHDAQPLEAPPGGIHDQPGVGCRAGRHELAGQAVRHESARHRSDRQQGAFRASKVHPRAEGAVDRAGGAVRGGGEPLGPGVRHSGAGATARAAACARASGGRSGAGTARVPTPAAIDPAGSPAGRCRGPARPAGGRSSARVRGAS